MFRARAADQAHAASAPDTAWPVHRVAARLIPGAGQGPPVSMPLHLTALQRRRSAESSARPGASGASSWSPPDAIFRAFPLSLTTTVFSQRSTGWFDACPRRPTPEGQPSSISRTAPLQKDLLHGPPSTFMTHCPLTTGRSPPGRVPDRRPCGTGSGAAKRHRDSSTPRVRCHRTVRQCAFLHGGLPRWPVIDQAIAKPTKAAPLIAAGTGRRCSSQPAVMLAVAASRVANHHTRLSTSTGLSRASTPRANG